MLEPGSQELLYLNRHTPAGELDTLPYRQGLKALLAGQADAISAYSTTEPFYLAKMGIPYRVFSPRAASTSTSMVTTCSPRNAS
ncbi:hypothetical protein ACTG25_26340 [Aeromonas sp. 80P]